MMRGGRTTLILLAMLGGLVVFLLYSNNAEPEAAEATPAPSAYLWELTSQEVARLSVVDNTRQTAVTLRRDNLGLWQVEANRLGGGQALTPAQAADPGLAEYAASLVSTIFLRRTLTETTALGEYGLLAPAYEIEVTKRDGSELALRVGYKTATGDGYYVVGRGEPHPQIVAASALDPLFAFVENPPVVPTPFPTEAAAPAAETATAEP
jgi:hypothetical protein